MVLNFCNNKKKLSVLVIKSKTMQAGLYPCFPMYAAAYTELNFGLLLNWDILAFCNDRLYFKMKVV